jgi:hypothetical protein
MEFRVCSLLNITCHLPVHYCSCFRRPNDLTYPNLHNSLGPNVGSIEQNSEEWADAHVCTRTRVDKTLSSRRQVR